MLIDFRVTNFRSVKDAQTLSLVASASKELVETNTFDPDLPGFQRLLRSVVIYGANAAGKTNLLRAIQVMQSLVLNSAAKSQPGTPIAYMPHLLATGTRNAPSTFEATFAEAGIRYEYGFSVGPKRFSNEWLIAFPKGRPQRLFERTYDEKTQSYEFEFGAGLRGSRTVWRDATRENALFLSTAVQLNSNSVELLAAFHWFQKRLVVIVSGTEMNATLTLKLLEESEGRSKVLNLLRSADLGIADISVHREPLVPGAAIAGNVFLEKLSENPIPNVVRVTSFHAAIDMKEPIPFDIGDESHGTQRLFQTAGAWLNVLANGEVLLIDEIDTSLHPLMTRFLVDLFHSTNTNAKNAQLIFTTHDTSLLAAEAEVFRRDQVWFVEKTGGGASHLYPLSDFSPRKKEAIERGYLRGRYGALPILSEVKH